MDGIMDTAFQRDRKSASPGRRPTVTSTCLCEAGTAVTFVAQNVQQVAHRSRSTPIAGHLPPECVVHHLGSQVELVLKELVLVQDGDAVRGSGLGWEVPQIRGHEQLGSTASRGGQDVPVLGVVRHRVDEVLVVVTSASGK